MIYNYPTEHEEATWAHQRAYDALKRQRDEAVEAQCVLSERVGQLEADLATLRQERDEARKEQERLRAIAMDALAVWQGEDDTEDGPHRWGRTARARATLRARIAALTPPAATPQEER